jgi:hypothetical protein
MSHLLFVLGLEKVHLLHFHTAFEPLSTPPAVVATVDIVCGLPLLHMSHLLFVLGLEKVHLLHFHAWEMDGDGGTGGDDTPQLALLVFIAAVWGVTFTVASV